MFDYLGMVCLAGNQVWWTWEVEDVFENLKKGAKTGMKDFAKKQHSQIDDLVVQVSFFDYFLFFNLPQLETLDLVTNLNPQLQVDK